MGFSSQLLYLSLGAAFVGIAAGLRQPNAHRLIAVAFASASVVVAGGLCVLGALGTVGVFGVAHALYLAATVTVPVMALGVLLIGVVRTELRSRALYLTLLAGVVPAIVGVYATHIEPNRLYTDRHKVFVDGSTSLRVGVLADLQTPNVGSHEREAIRRLLAASPDVVLVAGDLYQMSGADFEGRVPEFRELMVELVDAVPHVIVVEGDADTFGGLTRILEGTGAMLLQNDVEVLDVGGGALAVGGLGNNSHDTEAGRVVIEELASMTADVTTVLLSHRPDALLRVRPGAIDLIVAGHTHGGQIALPLFGPLFTLSDIPRHVAAGGLHEVRGQMIYVSAGAGLERHRAPQVRFLVRPSVAILDLEATR